MTSPVPGSDTSVASLDSSRPRRPPRRVSSTYSIRSVNAREERSDDLSNLEAQGSDRIIRSQLDRIKNENRSTSTDNDTDRTPTKHNYFTAPNSDERIENVSSHRAKYYDEDDDDPDNSRSRMAKLRQSRGDSSLERIPIPRLRHQSSAATIRSSELAEENDFDASTSSIGTVREQRESLAPREERRNKGPVYEHEIQQMRSESRLRDDEEEDHRSFSRASTSRQDTTDTSGTEGSGPVIENRRRKKSSASSASKRTAARAAGVRDNQTSSPKRTSPQKERLLISSDRSNFSGRNPYATLTSPLRTESAMEFVSPDRSMVSRRAPLPTSFQSSRYRSDALVDPQYEQERRRNSSEHAGQREMWPRGEELPSKSPLDRREDRRRRNVSEAISSSLEGSSRQGRLVVDTSGVAKHLSRASKYGSVTAGRSQPSEWSDRDSNRSASELARQRKISTSSSISQRSSSGVSDSHRSTSRASLRRSHGRDVFDDGGAPPLPGHSAHPLSPRFLTAEQQQQQIVAMAQTLKQRQDRLQESRTAKGEDWRREVEDLQTRIDQLVATAGTASSPLLEVHSRSSSRASTSAPRSNHSNISSTPSASIARRANRPSTEPRRSRNDQTRVSSDAPLGGYSRYETSSRLGLRENDRRLLPVTPNMIESRTGSNSRMSGVQTGPLPSTGRFSSLGQSAKRSMSASTGSGPLHERNLLNSAEVFEKYLLESSKSSLDTPSSSRNAAEAMELINRFKETSDAAININGGLRSLLQTVLELQIDAEVREPSSENSRFFSDIDRSLSQILRDSDDQIRSLTDGLITFTRAEKERDRLRRLISDQSSTAMLPRSSSRLSSLGLSQMSPERERLMGRESQLGRRDAERRSSSFDLRRSISVRDRGRMTPSTSNTSIQAVESRSDKSSGSRKSSDSGQQQQTSLNRRFSMIHENSSTASNFSASPYSPSPHPTTVGQSRPGLVSPTFDMHAALNRKQHNMSHARSFSDLSPKNRATDMFSQRSPLLRRDKSSTNSVQTVRAPPSLSPRRPRLSFPKVSATTVSATTMAGAMNNDLINGTDDSFNVEQNGNGNEYYEQHRNGEMDKIARESSDSRAFRSLGRNKGMQVSREEE